MRRPGVVREREREFEGAGNIEREREIGGLSTVKGGKVNNCCLVFFFFSFLSLAFWAFEI